MEANTYDGEVQWGAVLSPKGALKEHVPDVMTCAAVEISHVEQLGLEVLEIGLILESCQNIRLSQVWVSYLVFIVEEGQELPYMIEVVPGNFGEAKLVEVTEGNRREGEVSGCHLIQLGDVGILKVI